MKNKKIKIAIDVSPVVYGTGVSVYTRNLVKYLLQVDQNNEYILFGGSLRRKNDLKDFFSDLDGSFSHKIFNIPPTLADIVWNRLGILSIEKLIGKIDVFHSSDWAQPPSHAFKVTTIHDLSPFLFPEETDPRVRSVHKRRLNRVKECVDRVIVPSEATKNDLVNLGFNENKVRVIPEAVEFESGEKFDLESVKNNARVKGDYLLAVGANKRKNIKRIVAAFEKVRATTNIENLVIVGNASHNMESVRGVRQLGYVSDGDLKALYSGASALVYASLYEGFGLPILEAFKYKCPVVVSNTSSMPEVAGSAAIYVEPDRVQSISDGIINALKNKQALIKKGSARLKEFSWEKTARMTLEVYREFLD